METAKTNHLTPNVDRILHAVYHLLKTAEREGKLLSQYDIVKSLFLADREHLNEWGRPITFDNYMAMKHGPVPTLAYDFLKNNAKALREHGVQKLPWTSSFVANGNGRRDFRPSSDKIDVLDVLSESDLEALEHALSDVLRLGFGQIRRLTHDDPAYVEAWRDDGDRKAYEMKLGLLFEEPNFERADLIEEQSANV